MGELRQRPSKVQPAVDGLSNTQALPENDGRSQVGRSRLRSKETTKIKWKHLALIGALYTILVYALYRALVFVPQPLGLDAPERSFSEARALNIAAHLSENIGRRQVTTPALEEAGNYVESKAKELQDFARSHRPDLLVEVDREQTTGAFNLVFVNTAITNAYNNLTNIILRIAPKDALHRKAVMINAHYDTFFESPGASDCAACVGTALEMARVIVADPSIQLAAPLLLLLNGGEETILTAAHGFMAGSKWADGVGAFINLESTGPGGPDVLFQHTGSWTLDAYAKGAKYPRGSVFAQDFFESRLMSMDTDFRLFSADYLGRLPGIDIAQVLDGAAYHSHQDTVDRIRKGTIQMLGENVLGSTIHFAEALRHQEEHGLPEWDAKGSVYVDLLGHRMIRYPVHFGRLVHSLAIPAVLLSIALMPRAKAGPRPIVAVLRGAGVWLAAAIMGMALPAALGVLRVVLTGKPMIWFGRNYLAYAIYAPAAVAGILIPLAAFPPLAYGLDAAVLGVALVQALETAVLTALGMKSTFAFALWAFAAAASALYPGKASTVKLMWTLVTTLPALVGVGPFVSSLPLFLAEHMSIGGAGQPPLGHLAADVLLGLLFGAVAAFMLGHLAIWIAHALRPRMWHLVALLLLASVAAAAYASQLAHPYSREFPKRVMLQHLHVLSPAGDLQESKWMVGALDVFPIEKVLPEGQDFIPTMYDDWQALYPVDKLMRWVALPAAPADNDLYQPGGISIELDKLEPAGEVQSGGNRLHLVMQLPWPGWGLLNVTGPVVGWSFTSESNATGERVTRFCGNEGSQHWPFWLDAEGDWKGNVRVELSVMSLQNTSELHAFASSLPEWTTVSRFTSFKTAFTF